MPDQLPEAVANEFLKRRASAAWPQQMYIQKLVYMAHGWNLAINGEPLVIEPPQAWDKGPVFRRIWDHVRDHGWRGNNCTLIDPATGREIMAHLTDSERQIIDHVWGRYGGHSGEHLSKMTHEPGTPWYRAYFNRSRNAYLDNNEIRTHYINLALAGREQQSKY